MRKTRSTTKWLVFISRDQLDIDDTPDDVTMRRCGATYLESVVTARKYLSIVYSVT
jgi:hypothetical protein